MAKSTKLQKSKPNKITPAAALTRRDMMKLIRNDGFATIAVAGVQSMI